MVKIFASPWKMLHLRIAREFLLFIGIVALVGFASPVKSADEYCDVEWEGCLNPPVMGGDGVCLGSTCNIECLYETFLFSGCASVAAYRCSGGDCMDTWRNCGDALYYHCKCSPGGSCVQETTEIVQCTPDAFCGLAPH